MGTSHALREAPGAQSSRDAAYAREPELLPNVVATAHGRRDGIVRRVLGCADAAAIVIAIAAAAALANPGALGEHVLWGTLLLPMWIVLFKLYGLYDRDVKRVSHTTVDDAPWAFHALLVGGLLTWGFVSLVGAPKLILAEAAAFGAIGMVAMLGLRSAVRGAMTQRLAPERVLLVGAESLTDVLIRKMRQHPEYGLDPVGVLCPGARASRKLAVPVVGSPADLRAAVVEHRIDRIVLSRPSLDEQGQIELLRRCRELSLKVSVLPELFETMGPSMEVDDVEGITLLCLHPPVLSRSSRFIKRSLDVIGASLLLTIFAPAVLLIALAIKVDSRGPVFFCQDRIGKESRRFRLWKFRTMCDDAESRVEELRGLSKDPDWLHLEHDPRITRVGRILRLTSLDELPQLWNVLRGEMSLVGPRPLVESEDRLIDGWGRSRLQLTPGLTGSWQVLGRTSIPFEEMVKLDYLYVTNWSLWTDIRLIVRTLPAVAMRRGAN